MTTMTNAPDEARELTLSLIEALWGLDPDSEIWRASLRRARRAGGAPMTALLQFAHVHINRRGEERCTFTPLPFSSLPERPRRVQRKPLGQYAVRLWLVGSPTADAPGWRTKRP